MNMSELVAGLTSRLRDPNLRCPASAFRAGSGVAHQPGLYAWWVDEDGREMLSAPFGVMLPPLVYAGQAGASSTRNGRSYRSTLHSRIWGNHLNGNVGSSTFRETLTAVLLRPLRLELAGPRRLTEASNHTISSWMRAHLAVALAPCTDRTTLADVECAVVGSLDPPLNLKGVPLTPVRARLTELRRLLARGVETT